MFISMLLLSRFSRVRLCVTPETAAHQAPWSLGFSRQEHWSGLPFPSPMQESEEWKWSRSAVSDSSRPHGLQPTRLLLPWDFLGKSTGVGCYCLLREHSRRSQSWGTSWGSFLRREVSAAECRGVPSGLRHPLGQQPRPLPELWDTRHQQGNESRGESRWSSFLEARVIRGLFPEN